jgi:hypothetical protein
MGYFRRFHYVYVGAQAKGKGDAAKKIACWRFDCGFDRRILWARLSPFLHWGRIIAASDRLLGGVIAWPFVC